MLEIYSYHTFMFPFRWSEMNTPDVMQYGWKYQPFDETKSVEDYNEFNYFHEFVQRTLYNKTHEKNNKMPSAYYEKNGFDGLPYEFTVLNPDKNANKKEIFFSLKIHGVSLRTFETGVAVLSINLQNFNHRTFEEVLMINDYGRRLYPQFLASPKKDNYAYEAHKVFLPMSVRFATFEETSFTIKKIEKFKLPEYITKLIGETKIKPLLDDRMFVLSHIMDTGLSNSLKNGYLDDQRWYKYVFVDSHSLSCQDMSMRKKIIEQATYERWSGYGTLYGITRYSFVCISDAGDFSRFVVNQHIRRHYFQMMNLTLAVRASIISFSDQVAGISLHDGTELSKKVSEFYKRYIQFVNRIYFREISPQEQGIELYAKTLEMMQIKQNIEDLDGEIAELFNYAEMKEQASLNEHMAKLTEYGIPLMIMGLFAGIFGMNTIEFGASKMAWDINIGTVSLALILLAGVAIPTWKCFKSRCFKWKTK